MYRMIGSVMLGTLLALTLGGVGTAQAEDAEAIAPAPTVDGYMGIWFTLGQFREYGDKYSGGLGTYTAKHIPLAYYVEEVNKTFFVYGGTRAPDENHLLCMVSYFDHDTGRVPKPRIVHDKDGVIDPHDNPSIAVDEHGHIWVFVSGRGTGRPGFKYRSVEPYSIEAFELIEERELTYPQPFWLEGKGFLHSFTQYRTGRFLYWETSDITGENWSETHALAEFGGHYQITNAQNGRVFTVFNYHPDHSVDRRTNMYYAETGDFGETWTNAQGEVLELPLTDPDNSALARDYESEGLLNYNKDIQLDVDGNPVVLQVTSQGYEPGPDNAPRAWVTAKWNGEAWDFNEITDTGHNYDTGSIYIEENGAWRVMIPSETGPQEWGTGGEVALWISEDQGANWRKARDVTRNSQYNHGYVRRPVNAHPDFYAFWADGNPDEFSESRLYFTNHAGNIVRSLPYYMELDYETPGFYE